MIKTIIILSLIILAGCDNNSTSSRSDMESKLRFAAENAVKTRLKDPKSAEILGMVVFDNVVCGSVNSKNSFGGYTGETLFMSGGTADTTFFETDMKQADFEHVWNIKCK